jgi:CRISPR-associated endonuclease Csn1
MNEKIFLGLDIGTSSCGFALTDGDYNVIQKRGKALWGTRQFDEAQPAADRRVKRATRRRLDRRKHRIALLQRLFAEEIEKVDPLFFMRLSSSSLWEEDKPDIGKYSLFNDAEYADKQHFRKYKSIYHLRSDLMKNGNCDIRLLYLAAHHIIKYRGHFLIEGQKFDINALGIESLRTLNDYFSEEDNDEVNGLRFDISDGDGINQIAADGTISLSVRQKRLAQILGCAGNKKAVKIIAVFSGGKVKLSDLFDELDDSEIDKLCFDGKYEENEPKLQAAVGDKFYLIKLLKSVYDWLVLARISKGHENISDAMLGIFDKHNEDLNRLKKFIKRYYPKKYYAIFRSNDEKTGYCAYVGSNLNRGKVIVKKCSKEEFYIFVKRVLAEKADILADDTEYKYFMAEIEKGTLLQKMNTKDNGTIPYQLHEIELSKILDKAAEFHPFLNEADGYGTVKDKLLSVLTFRVPYYVGPLNGHGKATGANVWIEKLSNALETKIFPWNFKDVVDEQKSAEAFIRRMTNKCTYLFKEDVLAKQSLRYSEFMVLNELNNLKINGERVPVSLKCKIYDELFKQKKTVSMRSLVSFLKSEGYVYIDETAISGIDGGFKSSLASYITMRGIFGAELERNRDIAEKAIFWHTIFPEKSMVEKQLRLHYGRLLDDVKIKALKGLTFSGWGSFSEKFLSGNSAEGADGASASVIELLYSTNKNLQELLADGRFGFAETIREENGCNDSEISYESVKEMYCSPAVKRAVWQANLITDELVKAAGRAPDKIFIEVTRSGRESEKGKRTKSRKQQIESLYRESKLAAGELEKLHTEISGLTDAQLRSDKLFLYFMQLGKCAYSGEPIDLSRANDYYDIDHIVPQSVIKDDSLNNRVLVTRKANADKGDTYPVPKEYREKGIALWQTWLRHNLISKEKFSRLTRTVPLTIDEQAEFINRQIVFTGQAAKAVAKLFEDKFRAYGTEIVYSKAGNVSDFRHRFELLKSRDVNDFHHAKDAYLNIVVGNVFNTKFGHNAYFYLRDAQGSGGSNVDKIYNYDIKNAWRAGGSTIDTVRKNMARNNCLVTKKVREEHGQFYDQTVYGFDKEKPDAALIPRKEREPFGDTVKYGGYKGRTPAYFTLAEYTDKKGKTIRSVEEIPLLYAARFEKKPELIDGYLRTEYGIKDAKIIIPKIRKGTLFCVKGSYVRLAGKTGKYIIFHNANQWYVSDETADYVRLISKFNDKCKGGLLRKDTLDKEITVLPTGAKNGKIYRLTDRQNCRLYDEITAKFSKDIYKGISLSGKCNELKERRESFVALTTAEQTVVLTECIKLLQCNAVSTADLSLIGGKKNTGTILTGKALSGDIKLITESVTGLYTNATVLSKEE